MWVYIYSLQFVATVRLRYTITSILKHVPADTHLGEGRISLGITETRLQMSFTSLLFMASDGRTYGQNHACSFESPISKSF